jgi:sugar diacid utilization regulator
MPLYTIPWETRMVDVTRDICYRIMKSEETEASIASTIKNIIFKVGDLDTLISQMERYSYLRDSRFCFIAIAFENSQNKDKEYNMKKIKMYSEKIARSIHQLYISFAYNDCCILVLVDYSDYDIDNFVNTFLKNWDDDLWKIHIGISENLNDIRVQDENFNKALTAMKMAKKKGKKVRDYKKLDIYKLLLNSKDKQVLKEYYEDTIGKLEKYDEENNTDLTDFLHMYLKNNGSQSLVAEKQYIHRNTVNNQLKKIEKITGYNPLDLEEKLRFYLGFYIKDLL